MPTPPGLLAERDEALASVLNGAENAAPGAGSAWLVCAEGGGGKTAFLRAVAGRLRGARLHWGEAEPISPPEPYFAIARALPDLVLDGPERTVTRAAVAALAGGEGQAPVAIVLDDLHFADDGTVAVAQRLALEARSRGWLVMLAFRPREGLPALHEMAAELIAHGRATRLDLPALTRSGVREMVEHLRGTPVEDAEVERIFADSAGNPWFVEALARGDASLSAAHSRVQVRLSRLERELPGAFGVLTSLAAVTGRVGYDVVVQLCGGDTPGLRTLLKQLLEARILEERDDLWCFRQELMRRAILEGMIPAERRDAHRRLAESLERHGRAAELAMHFAAAADPRAGAWALQAAREAIRLEAHAEAYAQLQRALTCPLTPEDEVEACALAVDEAAVAGRIEEPVLYARRGLALCRADDQQTARIALAAAVTLHWRGEGEAAGEFWSQAADAAERLGKGPAAATVFAWRALCSAASEDGTATVHAAALAARYSSGKSPCVARLAGLIAAMQAGDPEAASAAPAVLEELRTGGLVGCTMGLAAFADTAVHALELDAAEHAVAMLDEMLERRQVGIRLSNAALTAFVALQRGGLAEPRVPRPSELAIPPRAGVTARLSATWAVHELRGGSLAQARAFIDAGLASGRPLSATSLELARVEYLSMTAPAEAVVLARELMERGDAERNARLCGEAAVALARAAERSARPEWLPAASRLDVFWVWADAIVARDSAVLRSVAQSFEALGCPYEAALVLADAGDLADAYRRLRALDATSMREQLAGRLRAAGLPVPRRTQSAIAVDGLTDTERAVCTAVVAGDSNKAIAEAMSVSVRTVETHLVNVYRKTGASGRGALARWWTQRENA